MTIKLLQIEDLTYRKNNKLILNNVNLTLETGHFIGLAGANGAGKTTLMRLIAGVAKHYKGRILFEDDDDVVQRKAHVSYSDELQGFAPQTPINKIMQFYQSVYPDFAVDRYQQLAKFLNLEGKQKLGNLSKGNRERLTIALTLARKAQLYLLDEPFSGIDVMSRKKIIQGMLNWVDDSASVLISSHHLEEISQILDELVIIKDQTVLTHRSTEEIVEQEHRSVEEYFESLYEEQEEQADD